MIRDDAVLELAWVPLTQVAFDDQAIDWPTVATYAELMQEGGHLAPPILNRDMSVRDGRHRLIAHRALGRPAARCLIVHEGGNRG